ncbi:hypothetical protein D9613_008240 [Agrocybe pediades]|uniref:DUF3074 domain-containing protein n=1 Tax=Agrocybe pediades TaxID=84607 RepID=A0A8H4QSH0_9AGAR|nr:hypothetical protein D9613_008240 [Agrocybe pediades]KAF9555876.1 hypothetical protein CPC08DRAFT_670467 [Agrocybe pediades]
MAAKNNYRTPLITILNPLKPSQLPSEEEIIAQGKALLEESTTWKAGKLCWDVVETAYRPKLPGDGAPFHCRISVHTPEEISFDLLWDKMSRNKPQNEMGFNREMQKVTLIKELSPTATIWSMFYKFQPPVSNRVFTELQVIHFSEAKPRTGIVVTIPIDITSPEDAELAKLEESGVKAKYACVERVMELPNGNTEWRCATSGTAGGSIPDWLVEPTLEKKVAQDVPLFFEWLRKTEGRSA